MRVWRVASSPLPQTVIQRRCFHFNGTSSTGQFISILHRVFMERVSKLSGALGIQSQVSKMFKSMWDVDAPAHTQQNGVKHDTVSFQLIVTKIFCVVVERLQVDDLV